MVACCPLSGNCDGDAASVYSRSEVRAAKEHACSECWKPIKRGDRYDLVKGCWDGSWSTFRTCFLCVEIREHFDCGEGWIFGQLWQDLRDNFFPDMRCGGICMEGLSPAAKAKLSGERMEWYLDQDEVDDSAWEDWPKHRDRQRPPRPPEPLVDDSDPPAARAAREWVW